MYIVYLDLLLWNVIVCVSPSLLSAILFEGYKPLAGSASIQFANGDDWEARRKCLFPSLLGDNLKGYGPIFVEIGKVSLRDDCSSCPVQTSHVYFNY